MTTFRGEDDRPLPELPRVAADANVIAQLDDELAIGDAVELDGDYELRRGEDGALRGARLVAAD